MNWRHFWAFVWLRWRIRVNQVKRAGVVSAVITALFVAGMIPGAALLFAGAFAAGVFLVPLIPEAQQPRILMYIWDGIAVAFLMAWLLGLLTELQRSEALSLTQFLHLPVSLAGVFIINYLSSLLSLNVLLFVPAMVGFILGLTIGINAWMLLALPLLAVFLFAATAVTYQFQGWLATLMTNPRRRRTIVVTFTMLAILLCQLPNLINVLHPWDRSSRERDAAMQKATAELVNALNERQIDMAEFQRRQQELQHQHRHQDANDIDWETLAYTEEVVGILNYALPPLWLALGVGDSAAGNPLPAVLGTLGLGLIGTVSLWRAYRTTLRLYTGVYTGATRPDTALAPTALAPAPVRAALPARPTLLEWRLPALSERASAIAVATFRSVLRAPEAKMLLLTPLIMVLVFGSMLFSGNVEPPPSARPFMAFAAMLMVLMGMTQLIGNQFGYDRSGFRVFVMCPTPRRDVLLGKNMALAPITLGLGYALILVLQILLPMRPDHLLLVVLQAVAMYLLYCLLANTVSILAPVAVAANAMRPMKPSGLQLLVQLGLAFLFPLALMPLLLPLGVDALLGWLDWLAWLPVGLLLMIVEFGLVLLLYHVALGWQGKLLQAREQRILEIVTAKAE